MIWFPNPELEWERREETTTLGPDDVERRLGRTPRSVRVLGGGLANLNALVDLGDEDETVLRIYRRHPLERAKEAALLRHGWRSFRVPAIVAEGDDWLLLEHVPHTRLESSASHGAATGRALAEIHAVRPEPIGAAGQLGPDLRVCEPWPDFVAALRQHTSEQLAPLTPDLAARVLATLDDHADELRAACGAPVLNHGDFKPSNLHWTSRGELLVLDWEFAFAGSALMDVSQLLRWSAPPEFTAAFTSRYPLPPEWPRLIRILGLVNLTGLLLRSPPGSRRARDALSWIERAVSVV